MLQAQLAMFECLGLGAVKPEAASVSVDMDAELQRIGLSGLPHEVKPSGEATDKLVAKAAKLAKSKAAPFINANLWAFLPSEARDAASAQDPNDEEEECETLKVMQKVMGVRKTKHTMSFVQLLEALQRYVVAGAMCDVKTRHIKTFLCYRFRTRHSKFA